MTKLPPPWAKIKPGWTYIGWIARKPGVPLSFWKLCQEALRSDHGELRAIDYYPQGAVRWHKER